MDMSKSETITINEGDINADVIFTNGRFQYMRFWVTGLEQSVVYLDSGERFEQLMVVLSVAQDLVGQL